MSTPSQTRSSWIKPVLIAALVAALGATAFATFNSQAVAPDVTYINLKGEKITSQSLRGKVVMVNFWATSCTTCVKEMPRMVETYNKFKDQGLEFVAVAMKYDPPNYVLNFAAERKLPFTVALDSGGDIAHKFGDVALTPTTFVIGKDGKILKRYVGEPDFGALHKLLQEALAG